MNRMNTGRWLLGGLAAGVVIWLLEGAASILYVEDMMTSLQAHNLSIRVDASTWVVSVLVSLITGWVAVFFYASVRPRFGPGPKTAVVVAVTLWCGGYLLSLLGYQMMGLFPPGLLVLWGAVGLVEMVLATLLGAWLYRE